MGLFNMFKKSKPTPPPQQPSYTPMRVVSAVPETLKVTYSFKDDGNYFFIREDDYELFPIKCDSIMMLDVSEDEPCTLISVYEKYVAAVRHFPEGDPGMAVYSIGLRAMDERKYDFAMTLFYSAKAAGCSDAENMMKTAESNLRSQYLSGEKIASGYHVCIQRYISLLSECGITVNEKYFVVGFIQKQEGHYDSSYDLILADKKTSQRIHVNAKTGRVNLRVDRQDFFRLVTPSQFIIKDGSLYSDEHVYATLKVED